ncbi:hypothetical protein [Nonomuraea sp. NPDC049784]|uniref:hypothetical protein n=1 Tax=Nonomuraea sp. NPDC049784 TaxID=3154361 RepID=UPI0033C931BE
MPITANDCCDAGSWSSTWATEPGAVQIPGVDDYPQSFECADPGVWGPWGEGLTERLRDDIPVFAAEYQAGAIDLGSAGYDRCRELTGPAYFGRGPLGGATRSARHPPFPTYFGRAARSGEGGPPPSAGVGPGHRVG